MEVQNRGLGSRRRDRFKDPVRLQTEHTLGASFRVQGFLALEFRGLGLGARVHKGVAGVVRGSESLYITSILRCTGLWGLEFGTLGLKCTGHLLVDEMWFWCRLYYAEYAYIDYIRKPLGIVL